MRKHLIIPLLLLFHSFASAQGGAEKISLSEIDQLFLNNNFLLLQQKHNIHQSEAQILQAKVWSNPSITLSDINLWSNNTIEKLPPLWNGRAGKQQFVIELEQKIRTGGKRQKNIDLLKIEKQNQQLYFEELIRQFKLDIRQTINRYIRLQEVHALLEGQLKNFQKLEKAYRRQLAHDNISKINYIRIEAETKRFQSQISEVVIDKRKAIQELALLIGVPLNAEVIIHKDNETTYPLPSNKKDLEEIALGNRPDIERLRNEIELSERQVKLRKAERFPDLNFIVNYDHGGGVMHNFVGFGIAMDIPLFDRNKGNISMARIDQHKAIETQTFAVYTLHQEIKSLLDHLSKQRNNLDLWGVDFQKELHDLLETSTRNFERGNTSLLEFLDYVDFYMETFKEYFALEEDYNNNKEKMYFIIGKKL